MARAGPRKVQRYSLEFQAQGGRVESAAGCRGAGGRGRPRDSSFMLSRWRKQAREGTLRGSAALPSAVTKTKTPPAREMQRFQALQRAHAVLQEEHALLKNSSGSPPHESRDLRVHRPGTRKIRGSAAVSVVRRHARRLLTRGSGGRSARTRGRTGYCSRRCV